MLNKQSRADWNAKVALAVWEWERSNAWHSLAEHVARRLDGRRIGTPEVANSDRRPC